MTHIQWKDRYNIDYKDIDRQHRSLLAVLNEAIDLVREGAAGAQVSALFSRLVEYARRHFTYEEFYMEKGRFPGLSAHRQQHQGFIRKLLEIDARYDADDPRALAEILDFLKSWYVGHILNSDQEYAPHVKSLRGTLEIRAVIFDFGNVIARFDNSIFLDKLAELSGKPADELFEWIYRRAEVARRYESGGLTSAEFFAAVSEFCGVPLDRGAFMRAYCDIFTPNPEVAEVLAALKPRYRLGLISNTSEWHWQEVIRPLPASALFDAVSLSWQVGALKPDARIFQDCLDKLGLIAEECVYIDDIAEYVAAAEKMRFSAVHFISAAALRTALRRLGVRLE